MTEFPVLASGPAVIASLQVWTDYWITAQWIAHWLSRHVPVLYVNLRLSPLNPNKAYLWPRLFQPDRLYLVEVSPNLWVLDAVAVPFAGKLRWPMGALDARLALHQVQQAIQALGIRSPLLLTFDCRTEYLVGRLGERASVYYCDDPPPGGEWGEQAEARLCRKVDAVLAISDYHGRRLAPHCTGGRLAVVPHGYDFDGARQVAKDDGLEEPSVLCPISRPRIGYTGSIHDSYVDTDLICATASAHPEWPFVFIGPYENNPIGPALSKPNLQRLRALPNIHLLGPRPYTDLARFIKFFDVCIAPYNLARELPWDGIAPFKLLQYLSQAKPVVIPPLMGVADLGDIVYFYQDKQGFEQVLVHALSERDGRQTLARIEYAEGCSYERTLKRIDSHLQSVVCCRTS